MCLDRDREKIFMSTRKTELFEYSNKEEFQTNLVEWIGDILYDVLPEHGYEVRDEQIYTAFQLADAVCNTSVHLAEAGLGTGKTFAYLLTAIPYARFTGKPVVIACASPALQDQLAGEGGDIQKLSKVLGIDIDARIAKDPNQYICDVRANENTDEFGEMSKQIYEWLAKTKRGERSEIPTIPDQIWKKIKWEETMSCEICPSRGYCKLVKAREYYRGAEDLLIVDHATFFQDLWTREERRLNGETPMLPQYSAVIFDEGHKVLLPALMQAGHQISPEEMGNMIESLEEIQGARDSLEATTEKLKQVTDVFFAVLNQSLVKGEASTRQSIHRNDSLLKVCDILKKVLDRLLLELQIEQELYTESLTTNQMQAYEGQLEKAIKALERFGNSNPKNCIAWMDQRDGSLWVVPRNIGEMLKRHLYERKLPVVFTSATLSNEGNFDYFMRSMGMKEATSSTIGSPFAIEKQVVVYMAQMEEEVEKPFVKKMKRLLALLKQNGGRALVLVNSKNEMKRMKKSLEGISLPFEILWEDQGERGYLTRRFREEETSVLIGTDFWEGIDVPGRALTLVVIWQLPFASTDALIEVQRKEAKEQGLDPKTCVDYPEMGLRLKQGCGRLIRTETDKGAIVILDPVKGAPWEQVVYGAIPTGARVKILGAGAANKK